MPKKSSIQDSASFDLGLKEARAILGAEKQRLRDATRVKLCSAFEKWMELKEKTQMKSHEDVALYLLNIYEKWEKKVEPETSQESDLKPIAGWNIPMEKEYDLTRKQSKELQNLGKHAVKFSDISSKLTTLRKDTKLADIIFIIKDGAEVAAHKTILSLFSKTLQENVVRKCINPILSDATQCGLDGFLDLVYGLGVTLSHENFDDIMHVAEVLEADKVIARLKSVQHKIAAPKIDERTRTKEENNGFNVKEEIVNEQMDNNALKTTEEMCDNGVIQHETMDVINQENHAASEGYGACETSNMETEGKFAKLKNENFGAKDDNESVTIEQNEEKSDNELQDETMEIQEPETVPTNVNTKAMDGTSVVDIKPNYDTSNIGDVSKGHEIKTEVIDFNDSAEEYDDEYDDEYDEYNVEEDDSGTDILFTDSGSDFSFQDDKKDLDWSPDFEQTSSSIKTRSKKTAETNIISSNDDTSSDDSGDSDSHTRKHAKKTKTKTNGNKGRSKSKPRKTWREKYIDQAIGEFKCPNCQNILETKFKLREHVEAKHDQFMCPLCDQCFKTNGERDLHRQAHYRFKNSDSSMGDFFCDICDVQFSSKHIYLLHMLQPGHIKKRRSTKLCIQCATWIPDTGFKKHLSSKHDFSVTQCYICKEKLPVRIKRKKNQLNSAAEMQRHLYMKHKQRNYNCVFCDHTSFTLFYLRKHIVNTHHRLRIRQCKSCTFTCGAKHQMQTHMRKNHKLGASWVCNKCGDTFESFNLKKSHIDKKHPTLMPCEYCGKELSRKNMNQHVRVHTGHKPYICEHCGEKFAQKNSLNWHMSSKHSHLDEEKNISKKLK